MTSPKRKYSPEELTDAARADLLTLTNAGIHLDDAMPAALMVLADYASLRLAICKRAGIPLTAEAAVDELAAMHQLEPTDAERGQLAAVAQVLSIGRHSEVNAFIEAIRPENIPAPPRKKRSCKTMAQIIRRLQQIPEEMANNELTAPQARAEVYTLQTLLVLLKAQAPKQLQLPPAPATVDAIDASADDKQLEFAPEPPDLEEV